MTWQATPGSFTDQWLPLHAHYLATWEQRVSVLRCGLITLTVDVVSKKKSLKKKGKTRPQVCFFFPTAGFVLSVLMIEIEKAVSSFSFLVCVSVAKKILHFQADIKLCLWLHLLASLSFFSLCVLLSVSLWCFVQQLHPVPLNKIKPNRKHSKEINSGLRCLGHPFGS